MGALGGSSQEGATGAWEQHVVGATHWNNHEGAAKGPATMSPVASGSSCRLEQPRGSSHGTRRQLEQPQVGAAKQWQQARAEDGSRRWWEQHLGAATREQPVGPACKSSNMWDPRMGATASGSNQWKQQQVGAAGGSSQDERSYLVKDLLHGSYGPS